MGRVKETLRWLGGWLASRQSWVILLGAIGTALSLGAVPDLVLAFAKWVSLPEWVVLSVAAVSGVGLLTTAYVWLKARDGVGIVLFLPPRPNAHWSRERLDAMAAHALQNHQTTFRIDIDDLYPDLREGPDRLRLAQKLIQARLNEELGPGGGVGSTKVTFYLTSTLPDAFELGKQLKFQVHDHMRIHGEDGLPEGPAEAQGAGRILVAQTSEELGKTLFTAIHVDSRLYQAPRGTRAARVADLLQFSERENSPADGAAGTLALIADLTHNPGMRGTAWRVASTGRVAPEGRHLGYVLDRRDPWADGTPCSAALVVTGPNDHLPDDQAAYEGVAAAVIARWRAFIKEHQRDGGVEFLLFLAAPVSVAFALGATIGHYTRIVPHRGDLAGRTKEDPDAVTVNR